MSHPGDLSHGGDLSHPGDLSHGGDLSHPGDLSLGRDLSQGGDLSHTWGFITHWWEFIINPDQCMGHVYVGDLLKCPIKLGSSAGI